MLPLRTWLVYMDNPLNPKKCSPSRVECAVTSGSSQGGRSRSTYNGSGPVQSPAPRPLAPRRPGTMSRTAGAETAGPSSARYFQLEKIRCLPWPRAGRIPLPTRARACHTCPFPAAPHANSRPRQACRARRALGAACAGNAHPVRPAPGNAHPVRPAPGAVRLPRAPGAARAGLGPRLAQPSRPGTRQTPNLKKSRACSGRAPAWPRAGRNPRPPWPNHAKAPTAASLPGSTRAPLGVVCAQPVPGATRPKCGLHRALFSLIARRALRAPTSARAWRRSRGQARAGQSSHYWIIIRARLDVGPHYGP